MAKTNVDNEFILSPGNNNGRESLINDAVEIIKKHEGFRPFPYPDPLSELARKYRSSFSWGHSPPEKFFKVHITVDPSLGQPWTIGYGFTGRDVTHLSPEMSREAADARLKKVVTTYIAELSNRLNFFEKLPYECKLALTDMAYNMGVPRLMKFTRMLSAMEKGDFVTAAAEANRSIWANTVPARAKNVIRLISSSSRKL